MVGVEDSKGLTVILVGMFGKKARRVGLIAQRGLLDERLGIFHWLSWDYQ